MEFLTKKRMWLKLIGDKKLESMKMEIEQSFNGRLAQLSSYQYGGHAMEKEPIFRFEVK